ncbi:MAG: hypothetical protein WCG81_04700 [Candidatus Angelobacter sp.]
MIRSLFSAVIESPAPKYLIGGKAADYSSIAPHDEFTRDWRTTVWVLEQNKPTCRSIVLGHFDRTDAHLGALWSDDGVSAACGYNMNVISSIRVDS